MFREDLEIVSISYRCPQTNKIVEYKVEDNGQSFIGNSWDRSDGSGNSVRLNIGVCPSCGSRHNEVISSSEYVYDEV